MGQYLDTLRARRKAPSAIVHEYRTLRRTGKYKKYFAFEGGEDEIFYMHFFENLYSEVLVKTFICDGKGGVLGLRDSLETRYPDDKDVFYFVDADHDGYLNVKNADERTFVTRHYSVESYIFDVSVFKEVARRQFQVRRQDAILEHFTAIYQEGAVAFQKKVTQVMSYALALRINNIDPDLDGLRVKDLLTVDGLKVVPKKIDCLRLLRSCEVDQLCGLSNIRRVLKDVRNENFLNYTRGKIIAQYCMFILDVLAGGQLIKENGRNIAKAFVVGKSNIIAFAVDFISCPEELSEFYRRNVMAQ